MQPNVGNADNNLSLSDVSFLSNRLGEVIIKSQRYITVLHENGSAYFWSNTLVATGLRVQMALKVNSMIYKGALGKVISYGDRFFCQLLFDTVLPIEL